MIVYYQFCLVYILWNFIYSNVPSLLPVLPFRLSSLLRTSPTPSAANGLLCPVWVSHVHALPLSCTQHHLTPGIYQCATYRFFHWYIRFHHIRKVDQYQLRVTKPNWCSLQFRTARASQSSFPNSVSGGLQPERQIWLQGSFILVGICLYLRTLRGAPNARMTFVHSWLFILTFI